MCTILDIYHLIKKHFVHIVELRGRNSIHIKTAGQRTCVNFNVWKPAGFHGSSNNVTRCPSRLYSAMLTFDAYGRPKEIIGRQFGGYVMSIILKYATGEKNLNHDLHD